MLQEPFRFEPIYVERPWGGRHMESVLKRRLPQDGGCYGESWEISDRDGANSMVREGVWRGVSLHDLWQHHREAVFGKGYERFERFPLLCKVIDAAQNLSVQVHPPAQSAAKWGGEEKNELWYVLHSEPNARIYYGLKPGVAARDLPALFDRADPADALYAEHLNAGEHLYIPAGMPHAIGAGYVIAEIQQNSDTTYRLFDWHRVDAHGNGRALHIEQGLDSVLEFQTLCRHSGYLIDMPYFTTRKYTLQVGQAVPYSDPERFAVITVIGGELAWGGRSARPGEFILAPAHAMPLTAAKADTTVIVTDV